VIAVLRRRGTSVLPAAVAILAGLFGAALAAVMLSLQTKYTVALLGLLAVTLVALISGRPRQVLLGISILLLPLNVETNVGYSLPHLAGELLKLTAKIDIVHVPYRGAAPAVNDLLGQQVQMVFLDLPIILPQIKAGGLRAIAIGAPERAPTAMEVPTTAEAGMPDLKVENWYGMVAPAGTSADIVATLNRIATEAMRDPAVKEKLSSQGAILIGDTPEHFRGFIETEIKKWAKVIKDAGVQTDK
jgi:hypothetical protein